MEEDTAERGRASTAGSVTAAAAAAAAAAGTGATAIASDQTVKSLPPTTYYIPNFITEDEEAGILNKINTAPLPRWTHLTHRRLQTWPSQLTASNVLLSAPLPSWLVDPVIPRFESSLAVFARSPHAGPNHVLVNEYRPGQGIMPHEDGAAYYPVVATVSLGAAIVLDIYGKRDTGEREDKPRWRVLQEPRSLLVTTDEMYTDYLHGIAEVRADEDVGPETVVNWALLGCAEDFESGRYERKTRTSLTYRDVLKVSKLGSNLKFLGRR